MNSRGGYDVLIVGARAAGASLGLLLARQGRRVLMVDRDEFPSDTMSTHFMNPMNVALLHELGVLGDLLAAGFQKITRIRTWVEDCSLEGPSGPRGSFSLTPRRNILDQLLVDHAVAAGAGFRDRTRAERLLEEDGRVVGAVVRIGGGEPEEVRARITVGADGRGSKVAEWVGAEKYDDVPALRPAYYAYFRGIEPLAQPTVEIFFGGDQIGFLFPMRPGEDCVAVEMQPADFEDFRRDARGSLVARITKLPGMETRLRNAEIEGKVIGVRGVENYFRKPFGPGWALTGDAGYLKDPSTGLGVGDALKGSLLLAPSLGAALDGAGWESTMNTFQQTRDEWFRPFYHATLAATRMGDPNAEAVGWLRAVSGNPIAARSLLSLMQEAAAPVLPPGLAASVGRVARLYAAEPARATT